MEGRDLRIVYMGTPEFAVAPLRALVEGGYNVVAAVTMPDKPSGRGLRVNESAVKEYAVSAGLPVLQPVRLKDPEFLEQLHSYAADLFIVVAFRMLPEEVWGMPRLGTFNLHASLLPQYRGAAPINWALINGERESGVTTFFLNSRMDEGAVIGQTRVPIGERDDAGALHDKLLAAGTALVLDTVERIAAGKAVPQPQDGIAPAGLKPAPKIFKETCRIDFSHGGESIRNFIRGLSPYPAAWAELVPVPDDKRGENSDGREPLTVKIFSAEFVPDKPGAPANVMHNNMGAATCESVCPGDEGTGTIETDGRSYIDVICGGGRLRLGDIQPAGKRRMTVKEFLNGFRDIIFYRFK